MELAKPVQSDPRSRPKPFTFRPPKNNPIVIRLVKLILPILIRRIPKVAKVEIEDNGLKHLRGLKNKRCLLTPSHSGGMEPYIIMHLSKVLGTDFNYLAAMEAFEKSPIIGWVIQRMGVYSIIRGMPDRNSFSTTRKLLEQGKRPLVIFPEGQTCWYNDVVMPFQEGVIQLAFKSFEDVSKKER